MNDVERERREDIEAERERERLAELERTVVYTVEGDGRPVLRGRLPGSRVPSAGEVQ